MTTAVAAATEYERIDDIKELRYGFVTGAAGCGKTAVIKEILRLEPTWGILTATTGVAAMNLSVDGQRVPTIHALLQCARIRDFRNKFNSGGLTQKLIGLKGEGAERIIIDECSMMTADVFGYIYRACIQADVGLILVGDFLQLPPVVKPEESGELENPHLL